MLAAGRTVFVRIKRFDIFHLICMYIKVISIFFLHYFSNTLIFFWGGRGGATHTHIYILYFRLLIYLCRGLRRMNLSQTSSCVLILIS